MKRLLSKLLIIPISIIVYSFFIQNSEAAFDTVSTNLPRLPNAGECVVKFRGKKDFSGTTYDYVQYFETNDNNLFRNSSNQLGVHQPGTAYYWSTTWQTDSNTTMQVFASTVTLLGPVYNDYLSTCPLDAYNTASYTGGLYLLPNPFNITSGVLVLNTNWSLNPDYIKQIEESDFKNFEYKIKIKTISPDQFNSSSHISIGYNGALGCYIRSVSATEHYIRCTANHSRYVASTNTRSIVNIQTDYKISDSSNVCGNIINSTTDITDINGVKVCNQPTNIIDEIMPDYTGIGWNPPSADWGTFEFLKDVFNTLFDFFDTMMEFAYNSLKTVVDFFVPDLYMFEDFFTAQYTAINNTFQLQTIGNNIGKAKEQFVNGLNSTSYTPNLSVTFHGVNSTILNLTEFKTAYDNSSLKYVIIFSLIGLNLLISIHLIRNIISYK